MSARAGEHRRAVSEHDSFLETLRHAGRSQAEPTASQQASYVRRVCDPITEVSVVAINGVCRVPPCLSAGKFQKGTACETILVAVQPASAFAVANGLIQRLRNIPETHSFLKLKRNEAQATGGCKHAKI